MGIPWNVLPDNHPSPPIVPVTPPTPERIKEDDDLSASFDMWKGDVFIRHVSSGDPNFDLFLQLQKTISRALTSDEFKEVLRAIDDAYETGRAHGDDAMLVSLLDERNIALADALKCRAQIIEQQAELTSLRAEIAAPHLLDAAYEAGRQLLNAREMELLAEVSELSAERFRRGETIAERDREITSLRAEIARLRAGPVAAPAQPKPAHGIGRMRDERAGYLHHD